MYFAKALGGPGAQGYDGQRSAARKNLPPKPGRRKHQEAGCREAGEKEPTNENSNEQDDRSCCW
jgi:hypothetical protein